MPEPAKDTVTPKTQPTQGRDPKIVVEINRTASRVDGINKKENDHRVLENDRPTDITRIVRENTCPVKESSSVTFSEFFSSDLPQTLRR
ncbi:unnamed protein product [Bathycoccus prasinos]